jgi:hypothetical protein
MLSEITVDGAEDGRIVVHGENHWFGQPPSQQVDDK